MSDGIWVGPSASPLLEDAVRAGGGRLVPLHEAVAVVWTGGGPDELAGLDVPLVRWIQLPSAGVEAWVRAGVVSGERVVTSAVGCYGPAVAEHALTLLLAGAHQVPQLSRARTWTSPQPRSLRGSTVAIVGCGGIGQALIELLVPFGVRVIAVTRTGRQVPGAAASVGRDDLLDVLPEADFVVLAAPATPDTHALIGAQELAALRADAWLVNVARGSLVDTAALLEALDDGRLGGAALDVTDPEPLPDGHPLWSHPRALVTPHSANPDSVAVAALATRVRRNTDRFLAGEALEGRVDPAAGY